MLRQIDRWLKQGQINDIDAHFAHAVSGWENTDQQGAGEATSAPVLLAACLLSHLSAAGHVCVDLAALAEQALPWDDNTAAPPLAVWLEALKSHSACGGAVAFTPLVLDGTLLYLRRYFDYECAVATAFTARSAKFPPAEEATLLQLFPQDLDDRQRDQRAAAAAALQQQITLISGGPGTGKTTTLAAILALLLEREPNLRIGLAAPTGKAAARMQEAVRGAKARLPLSAAVSSAMPEAALTLHRLLGARPQGGGMVWRHDAENPLALDVLVVDEASMIDLALMARVFAALPTSARLVLLGDRDQLASVDAGAIFADLCSAGAQTLNVSFRFSGGGGIAQLASLLREGEGDATLRLLANPPQGLAWQAQAERPALLANLAAKYAEYMAAVRAHAEPQELFAKFAAFRVLTPMRVGSHGVQALNSGIEEALGARGLITLKARAPARWYAGRPLMVTTNDYALKLFNGDIGLCVHDTASGELRVLFESEEGVRSLPPSRVPPHETAWAMTVHKSQGSEFDEVALVLPAEPVPLLTRELLYTAVTRAKERVSLWGNEAVIRSACAQRIRRYSGLAGRLLK